MKTRGFIFLFAILFSNFLTAQFYLKLSLDADGLYSVKLKANEPLTNELVVGAGKITITAPFGGFEVSDITSVSGEWKETPGFIGQVTYPDYHLKHDYFIISIQEGTSVFSKNLEEEEEITLFTFKNTGVCTGQVELLTAADPFVMEYDIIRPYQDFSAFDSETGNTLRVSGVYEVGNADCSIG